MDEAIQNLCSSCRERGSTNDRNGANRLTLRQTVLGLLLLLLLLLITFTMLGLTSDKISEMERNIDTIQSKGAAVRANALRQRKKRQANSENIDTFRGNHSNSESSHPVHSESQPTASADSLLADFKQRINRATSFDEIRTIIVQSSGLGDVFRSQTHTTEASETKGSAGVKTPFRRWPTTATTTTTTKVQLTKAVQKNLTCSRRNATIIGEFGVQNPNKPIQLSVCGPKETTLSSPEELTDILSEAAENQRHWMIRIQERSLCRPMEMIVKLEPEQTHEDPVMSFFSVMKCRLLYVASDIKENVVCVALKKKTKLVSFMHDTTIRSYVVSDHLECAATTNRTEFLRELETTTYKPTTKVKNKKKIKSCPWPFDKVSRNRCLCKKRKEGSKGYLRYMACRNIQKGVWKLQHRQARCIKSGRCLEPICDRKRFRRTTRRCPKTVQQKNNCQSSPRKPDT